MSARGRVPTIPMRILVVEDSSSLRSSLMIALQENGFAVDSAPDGPRALDCLGSVRYDLVVLDIMIPGIDGLELLKRLRRAGNDTQVLFLTAKDTVEDRVRGLREGADDYLTKPFALEEFLARVQVLCRRAYGRHDRILRIGDLEVDTVARCVRRGTVRVQLTAREYGVLEYLASREGNVVTRAEIEEHVYDAVASPLSNVVDTVIYSLRRKLAIAADAEPLIHTRRGLGYVLEEERD